MTNVDRRGLVFAGLGLALLLRPRFAIGQPATKKRVVRVTTPLDDPQASQKIRKSWAGMFAQHGLVDGENIEIEVVHPRTMQLDPNPEYDAIVKRVVESRPDVILVHMSWVRYFAVATSDIPIVFDGMIEPEYHRVIDSARHPGRNITGALYPLFEVQAKRIALAKEMLPRSKRVAVVCSPGGVLELINERIRATAQGLGMQGFALPMDDSFEKGRVSKALRDARVDIADFIVGSHPETASEMLRLGIAATCGGAPEADDGVLVSYDAVEIPEIAAALTARILRGERVATMPAQAPEKFQMTVNLRVAQALGATVPPAIILRAQRVFK
jgi:putative ABC transport system substrate-binding protein